MPVVTCPSCGERLRAQPGRRVRCPECGAAVVVEIQPVEADDATERIPAPERPRGGLPWFAWLLLGLVTLPLLFCGGCLFLGTLNGLTGRQPVAGARQEPEQDPIRVTAYELLGHYKGNEVAADATYKGKLVEVNGVIESIGKDFLGSPYVALEVRHETFCVQCCFDEAGESALVRLQPRRVVTIRGRCAGKAGNVVLRDCRVVKEGL